MIGLSYGGFMVNWLVGTTDRFKAAVSENGVTNQVSDWANSDSGPEYDRASLLGDPFSQEGIEKLWRQSPLRHVAVDPARRCSCSRPSPTCAARPRTTSSCSSRCATCGGRSNTSSTPRRSHTYASAGRPDRRIDRMTRMLDWFDRYLR